MSAISAIALNGYGITSPAATGFYGFGNGASTPTFPLEPKTTTTRDIATKASAPVTTLDQVQDEVRVSKAAEARLLYSQGQSLTEIEATLGVAESDVTSYLDLTNGTQSLTAAATAVVAASQTTAS